MENTSEKDIFGELETLPITDNLHDAIIEFYKNNYIKNEPFSKVINIAGCEQSIAAEEVIVRAVLQQNLGYILRHSKTKEIVVIVMSRIVTPEADSTLYHEIESPAHICAFEILHKIKESTDIFKLWNVDCVMEIFALSIRRDFVGRGLGTIFFQRSVELARQMFNGTLAQKEKDALPEYVKEQRPKGIFGIFTNYYSQKMGKKSGFETFLEIPYAELFWKGQSISESIDPIHKFISLAGIKF